MMGLKSLLIPLIVSLWIGCFVSAMPRTKSSLKNNAKTVYDQKQTGDYNIQLHLKDFQIIALLSDSLDLAGDYDYNYDYADFTLKPNNHTTTTTALPPITTTTPTTTSTTPSTTPKLPEAATTEKLKPQSHPYPFVSSSSHPSSSSPPTTTTQSTTTKTTTTATTTTTHKQPSVTIVSDKLSEVEQESDFIQNSPDKIKVQIIQGPLIPSVSIVPNEEMGHTQSTNNIPLGEIVHYRRCTAGFLRDKNGRCRRVRRPGTAPVPFNLGRLASNLAAKFRPPIDNSNQDSSNLDEDSDNSELYLRENH